MFTYIFIYIYASINALIEQVNSRQDIQKILNITFIVILILISGTRYYLGGSDYYVYELVFNSVPKLKDFFMNFNMLDQMYTTFGMEKGYLFLNSLIKTLGLNFFGFTLLHSIVFYTLTFKSIRRYSDRLALVLVIFLYKLFFYNTFISLRQSLTICIFLWMIKYIENNSFIKYFIGWIICIQIHRASIILLPIYFINRIKITKKRIIILNVICIPFIFISMLGINVISFLNPIINVINDPTFAEKTNSVINNNLGGISLLHTLEYFIIMIVALLNYDEIKKHDTKKQLILKLFLILLPIFTIFRGVDAVTRVKDYFTITYGVLLGYTCVLGRKKDLLKILIIIYYCAFTYFRFILLFDDGGLIPYKSYILNGLNIFQ